jgi:hypothetical protein
MTDVLHEVVGRSQMRIDEPGRVAGHDDVHVRVVRDEPRPGRSRSRRQ